MKGEIRIENAEIMKTSNRLNSDGSLEVTMTVRFIKNLQAPSIINDVAEMQVSGMPLILEVKKIQIDLVESKLGKPEDEKNKPTKKRTVKAPEPKPKSTVEIK